MIMVSVHSQRNTNHYPIGSVALETTKLRKMGAIRVHGFTGAWLQRRCARVGGSEIGKEGKRCKNSSATEA